MEPTCIIHRLRQRVQRRWDQTCLKFQGCYTSLCVASSCCHCERVIPIWSPFYQINNGTYVGNQLRTTLCHHCFHDRSLTLETQNVPEYYLTISKGLTGHTQITWVRTRYQKCLGCSKYHNSNYNVQRMTDILLKHDKSIDITSNVITIMEEIARLHWQRVVTQLTRTNLSQYETEMLALLDVVPDLYCPENFVTHSNPYLLSNQPSRTMNITSMAV